jgi:hypothetical protein
LKLEKVWAKEGRKEVGNIALLTKMSGRYRSPASALIVSVFLVAIPTARKIPESANLKNYLKKLKLLLPFLDQISVLTFACYNH